MAKSPKSSNNDPLSTPIMRQYIAIKEQNPDVVLFFRVGDFYEMFLEDAEKTAPLLDIALTKRQGEVPLAGVPHHSVDGYIAKLLSMGKKVALAEQTIDAENPKLMKREVQRIYTPGTLVEDSLLDSTKHNYIMAINFAGEESACAFADISTADFFAIVGDSISDLYVKYNPTEVLVPTNQLQKAKESLPTASLQPVEDWKASSIEGQRRLKAKFKIDIRSLGYEDETHPALGAISLILHSIESSFPGQNLDLEPPRLISSEGSVIDEQSIRNLEIVSTDKAKEDRTLLAILDQCKTSPGRRHLRELILNPLLNLDEIEGRLARVSFLTENLKQRNLIEENLSQIYDIERIISRIIAGREVPRDLVAIWTTLQIGEKLTSELQGDLRSNFFWKDEFTTLFKEIAKSIVDEVPAIFGNAPLIKEGIRKDLDEARSASSTLEQWLLDFEQSEKERTGISNLKVRYNNIVGYFIEVTKSQLHLVPTDYQRKQSLLGAERFICSALTEKEAMILGAADRVRTIELEEFKRLLGLCVAQKDEIRKLMRSISYLDVLQSFANLALRGRWVRPQFKDGILRIKGGRHPVVEKFLNRSESFVKNDVTMDGEKRIAILTGPNMAGKSTYIRQIAIIQMLAQIGSFVPAEKAELPIVDRIFTRIGASDNLTRGESTFYVEMLESARILNQCTERSLIIMDEVGRGTATYDGLSIAWSMLEFLDSRKKSPFTLFATHYHELTILEKLSGVFNLTMEVLETNNQILFTHKVKPGASDRSYGIHVAKLAGIPKEVIERAEIKLAELEERLPKRMRKVPKAVGEELGLFET